MREGVVIARVAVEAPYGLGGIQLAEPGDLLVFRAVGAKRSTGVGVDARCAERQTPPSALVVQEELWARGYHHVAGLGKAGAGNAALVLNPEALDLALYVGNKRQGSVQTGRKDQPLTAPMVTPLTK